MKRFILPTLLYVLFFNPLFLKGQVNKQDSLILIEFMNSMGIQYWKTDKQVERWAGIEVTGNRITEIYLSNGNYKGSIPSSIGNLTALTKLKISSGDVSGTIPESIGNLSALTELKLYQNNLSGEIPASLGNLKAITTLILYDTNLSGEIPPSIWNLATLTTLTLMENKLSGEIPPEIENLTSINKINLDRNNLTGKIPSEIGNLTSLQRIKLSDNKLSGEIPAKIGDLENLIMFHAHHNNISGTIPKELFNCNKLFSLNLGVNNLTDSIPSEIGNLTLLDYLDLSNNDLKGEVPPEIENLVVLRTLLLQNNQLEVCTKLPKSINRRLDLQNNRFNFDDLKPFATQKDISDFTYAPQDTIVLEKEIIGNQTELIMDAGGTQTTYQWYYNNSIITGSTADKYIVPAEKVAEKYHCEAKSSVLPELTLFGKLTDEESKDCWEAGQLKFCLRTGEWEKIKGTNKIKTNNIISINDFLYFNGIMTIDTTKLELEASGEFYVDNIPLPGGDIGKYTLLEGEQNLTLIGSEGKIMNFLNSGLSKTASLFGAQLSIDDLQFFSRQDTFGVKMGCSAHIPWVSASCGTPGIYTPGTDLKLKNLEITNKGIMSAGFEVENIGLFKKDYCLKRITYEHDWKKDIVIAGGDIALPFFAELGGGCKLENGKIDSVAWSIEGGTDAAVKTSPIGIGTFGVKGFYGHISGLNQPGQYDPANMDIRFGGIFSDVTSDKWYRITADGRTIWPKLFEFSGTGKILQPMDEIPYQVQGDIKATYDVPNNVLNIDYNGNFLTMDEQYWLATGSGGYTINHSKKETEVEGYFRGDITVPEISSYWPFNWFNSKAFGTYMKVYNENLKMVHGLLYYYPIPDMTSDAMLIKLAFIINTEKEFYESGYMRFPEDSRVDIAISYEVKSGTIDNTVTETFIVPENSKFGVIEIKSQTEAPISSIKSPLGEIFSATSFEDKVLYSETEDKKTAFWSLLTPDSGEWQITLENPENNDSIISHFQLKVRDFNFTMNQTGNSINLNWDAAQLDSGQVINFMFDDDNTGFDGFKVIGADATLGSVSFTLDDTYPDCNYYLYAQLFDESKVTEVYADDRIENHLSALAPPENFSFIKNVQTGEIDFSWNPSPSSEITGYILSVFDPTGNDSVYAVLNKETENISFFIENYEDKFARIESYNEEWKIGCPATLPSLVTAVNEINSIEEPATKLNIFPNPTTGNLSIRYFVSEPSKCEILVFDISGKKIAHPFKGFQTAGFHQVDFKYNNIPNGIYLIKFVNNRESFTVKSILNK